MLSLIALQWGVAHAGPPVPRICQNGHCYYLDELGGWGLKPKRTYTLAYDGDKVCKPIVDALNDALKSDPKKAIASVTYPMPQHPELHLEPSQIGPGGHGTFKSQNPLFSNPMFLRWQPYGGIAPPGGFTFESADWTERWLIVDLENNGHRYLVKNGGVVWDVPEDELDQHDWTLPDSWNDYKQLLTPWPGAQANAARTDPIDRWRWLDWEIPGQGRHGWSEEWQLPKMTTATMETGPWRMLERVLAHPQFALIDGQIYTVFSDGIYDLMIVDNLGRQLGDDLCYIQSNINDNIVIR